MKCDELKAFVARKIDYGTCDPVPCIEVYPKHGKPNNTTAHNRWRANMSEYCWLCRNFDNCTPGHKCRHQVDIDVQAQLGIKGE